MTCRGGLAALVKSRELDGDAMPDIADLLSSLLVVVDRSLPIAAGYLSGAAGPLFLLAYAAPLLLVLLARQPLHAIAVLMVALTAFAVVRLGSLPLGLCLYAGTYLVALHALATRAARRRAQATAAMLRRLEDEVHTFLDGLDRRSQEADRLRAIPPDPEKPRHAA